MACGGSFSGVSLDTLMDDRVKSGGYDAKFVDEVSEDYMCPICFMALKEPVQVESCGHIFCKSCLDDYIQTKGVTIGCPMDRADISKGKVFRDKNTERKVLALVVKCDQEQCDWKGELLDRQKHNESCLMWPMACPNKCGESNIARKELDHHIQTCQMVVRECRYSNIGCTFKGVHAHMDDHVTEDMNNHLDLAVGRVFQSEERTKRLELLFNQTIQKNEQMDLSLKQTIQKNEQMDLSLKQTIQKNEQMESRLNELLKGEMKKSERKGKKNEIFQTRRNEFVEAERKGKEGEESEKSRIETELRTANFSAPEGCRMASMFKYGINVWEVDWANYLCFTEVVGNHFYSCENGYKLQLAARSNDSNLRLFLYCWKIEANMSLKWPFSLKFSVHLLHPNDRKKNRFLTNFTPAKYSGRDAFCCDTKLSNDKVQQEFVVKSRIYIMCILNIPLT